MNDSVEIWLDSDLMPPTLVGRLTRGSKGTVRFQYAEEWLSHPGRFAIDPGTILDNATFHPDSGATYFGAFLDSSPDRWGETLMQRREALVALDGKRPPRTLYAWDFLLGVQDQTRQGALRLKFPPEGSAFLADEALPAPPLASLRELEHVARGRIPVDRQVPRAR